MNVDFYHSRADLCKRAGIDPSMIPSRSQEQNGGVKCDICMKVVLDERRLKIHTARMHG